MDDAGLIHLKGMTDLQFLSLSSTRITNAGLASLRGMTHLTALNLDDTGVSAAGARDFEKAIPSLAFPPGPIPPP